MKKIDSFSGEFRWLSNFWFARFELDGRQWPTVEHYYQAAKTDSPAHKAMIMAADSPASAKRHGGKARKRLRAKQDGQFGVLRGRARSCQVQPEPQSCPKVDCYWRYSAY